RSSTTFSPTSASRSSTPVPSCSDASPSRSTGSARPDGAIPKVECDDIGRMWARIRPTTSHSTLEEPPVPETQYAAANGLKIAYETFGSADNPPVLLIMGLGTQMIAWPD